MTNAFQSQILPLKAILLNMRRKLGVEIDCKIGLFLLFVGNDVIDSPIQRFKEALGPVCHGLVFAIG